MQQNIAAPLLPVAAAPIQPVAAAPMQQNVAAPMQPVVAAHMQQNVAAAMQPAAAAPVQAEPAGEPAAGPAGEAAGTKRRAEFALSSPGDKKQRSTDIPAVPEHPAAMDSTVEQTAPPSSGHSMDGTSEAEVHSMHCPILQ